MNSTASASNTDFCFKGAKIHKNVKNHVSIPTGHNRLPIEITLLGRFPAGAGKSFLENAFTRQRQHPEFIDEYNEPSARIGKTNFSAGDPTAVYSFGVDVRDLVFHRHAGHRVIVGVTGSKGCLLKFSTCTPEEAEQSPETFLKKLVIVRIPADHLFALRFNGTIYHQFCPIDNTEMAFMAVSVHTHEAFGLSGEILQQVLENEGSIPLLTEPAAEYVMRLLDQPNAWQFAEFIELES